MGVPAEKVAGKNIGLVSACCTTDFPDDVLVIVFVLWQKGDFQLFPLFPDFLGQAVVLFFSERLDFRIRILPPLPRLLLVCHPGSKLVVPCDRLIELGPFLVELRPCLDV